jgi:hypothetical protein
VLETRAHRQRGIGLTIKRASHHRDRLPWNELADKSDSAPPVIDDFPAHIKTQIYLLEIAMQRNWQTENARVQEEKSNDAQKSSSLVKIKLRPARQQRFQQFRIRHEIQHREVAPIRGEKWFEHGDRRGGSSAPHSIPKNGPESFRGTNRTSRDGGRDAPF